MKRVLIHVAAAAVVGLVVGCTPSAPAPAVKPGSGPAKPGAKVEHAHGEGPHGGALADWGGGAYHVEFTVDHDKKEVTVYLVGSDEKSPAPIKADKIHLVIDAPKTEIDLAAKPLAGESGGKSSRFVAVHDTIGIVREFSGTISGEIEGTPYSGDFKELPHDEHK